MVTLYLLLAERMSGKPERDASERTATGWRVKLDDGRHDTDYGWVTSRANEEYTRFSVDDTVALLWQICIMNSWKEGRGKIFNNTSDMQDLIKHVQDEADGSKSVRGQHNFNVRVEKRELHLRWS